jgi:hypothetical protein
VADRETARRLHLPWLAGAIALVVIGGILVLSLHPLKGDTSASRRPLSRQERKAERLERRSAAKPGDQNRQLAAMEAWFEAGGSQLTRVDVEIEPIPAAVREDFEAGLRIWDRYLEQTGGKVGADAAETAGAVSFELAEIGSRDPQDIEADVARAARALEIAGRHRHTLYTLSNVSVYAYFNGEYARGDVAARGAASGFKKRRRRAIVFEELDSSREHAKVFRRLLRQANAELGESGDELLEKPLKVYSGAGGINKDDPTE